MVEQMEEKEREDLMGEGDRKRVRNRKKEKE